MVVYGSTGTQIVKLTEETQEFLCLQSVENQVTPWLNMFEGS